MQELTLQDLIDKTVDENADRSTRAYLGGSIIGKKCARQLWYGFRWAKPVDFPPRIRRRFVTGHEMEERVVSRLREAGFTVQNQNPKARNPAKQYAVEYGPLGGLFRGHVDGIVTAPEELWQSIGAHGLNEETPVLLEVKVLASAKYKYTDDTYTEIAKNKTSGNLEGRYFKTARQGAKKAQPVHFAQMQTYMGLSAQADRNGRLHWQKWGLPAPLNHGLYIGVNSDTEQWYAELIEKAPAWFDRAIERAWQVIRAEEPPPRITHNPSDWECKFCDFSGICHRGESMERNCRTCEYAKIKVPGDAGFYGQTAQWVCSLHGSGCGDFTACDQWSPAEDESPMF